MDTEHIIGILVIVIVLLVLVSGYTFHQTQKSLATLQQNSASAESNIASAQSSIAALQNNHVILEYGVDTYIGCNGTASDPSCLLYAARTSTAGTYYSMNVSFANTYTTPPSNVIIGLNHIDGGTAGPAGIRLETSVSNITTTGFTLTIQTWGTSQFYGASVNWMAVR